jgi:hypothetical protein
MFQELLLTVRREILQKNRGDPSYTINYRELFALKNCLIFFPQVLPENRNAAPGIVNNKNAFGKMCSK